MKRYLRVYAGAILTLFCVSVAQAQQPLLISETNTEIPNLDGQPTKQVVVSAEQLQPAKTVNIEQLVSRYGVITESRPVGFGGLTAWTVEKNGRAVVLYTTADGEALFTGVVWDIKTGRNISDQFLPSVNNVMPTNNGNLTQKTSNSNNSQPSPMYPTAAMDGKYTGELPDSMLAVDSLAGVKEGNGAISDTVYIIIDPRCQYCRKAYNATRDYVKKGYSIKWIPTVALGDYQNGVQLAATILQSQDQSVLQRMLSKHEQIKTPPTEQMEGDLERNLMFMFGAFKQSGGEAGVPVAFFLDHRTGEPRMLTGVSEQPILDDIFGRR